MATAEAALLTAVELSIGEYAPIRSAYRIEVYGAIVEYMLTEGARVTRFRNRYKRAVADYFDAAFRMGFADAGSDPAGMDANDQEWLSLAINGEWGFIDELFMQMKINKVEMARDEALEWAGERADGYAKTLDGVYSQGKMRGVKGIMLTFVGNDGLENCSTCRRLKGKRHSAKWWISRGLGIFRGNRNYECGCWQCQHFFMTDKGEAYTL